MALAVGAALFIPCHWVTPETCLGLFTTGLYVAMAAAAVNNAVTNSHATKYAMADECMHTQTAIGVLQVISQNVLARILAPFVGYATAQQSLLNASLILLGLILLSGLLQLWGMRSGKDKK